MKYYVKQQQKPQKAFHLLLNAVQGFVCPQNSSDRQVGGRVGACSGSMGMASMALGAFALVQGLPLLKTVV